MNSGNEAFETLADRIKQHTFMNSASLYQRLDDYTFKRINRGPQEVVYTLDTEQTTRFSGLIPQLPMCVLDRTLQSMKEKNILVLKANQLYAGMFDISEPTHIDWGIFYLSDLGIWVRIDEEDEEPEMSFLSDAILADLCESKHYRLAHVTGTLQITKG